jgi:crotonobetainyl-CoA:carnitine CoA-transferase CaiB-like acyl-CoA transferase
MLVQVGFGDTKVKVFGSAVHLSEPSVGAEPRVPLIGEHNEAVYVDWLGLDRQSFESLRESKVI